MADRFAWLEDITGEQALGWVREQNERTFAALTQDEAFTGLRDELLAVLDTDARIPYVAMRGQWRYNFWRDAEHPRGLWRRTTADSYRAEHPEWEVLIDLDSLAVDEDENWVWDGAAVLRPDQELALVHLSRGGADATVIRESDMRTKAFRTDDAFVIGEAKNSMQWVDADEVLVSTDFGDGSMTDSGYPRTTRRWRRGTALADAPVVFEGEVADVSAGASYDSTPGFERTFASRSLDFYRSARFELRDGSWLPIDLPDDAGMGVHRRWMTVRPRSDWAVDGHRYPAGSLLAIDYEAFLAGDRGFVVLFAPDAHSSLEQAVWLHDHLVLVTLTDVRATVSVLTPADEGPWSATVLEGIPTGTAASVMAADARESNEFFIGASGFTTPATLFEATVDGAMTPVKHAPAFFDATGIVTEQFFATSDDGTEVPYFVVRSVTDGPAPTLLYAYGGFENSMTPGYSGMLGRGWLAAGGSYVLANIRGGGEYGPTWHTQAIREGRHLVFEDLAAVAADLVTRGITTAAQLGVQGGSNGGLLTAVMLTRYPELFGAVVSSVPLIDMRNYHHMLAGASWMAEYGDPDEPSDWEFIKAYSPYHNTDAARVYPPVLVTSSTRDDRVHPGHARKFVALLQDEGHAPVRYYENVEGGHEGAADNPQTAFRTALIYRFLQRALMSRGDA